MNKRLLTAKQDISYNSWRGAIDKRRYGTLVRENPKKFKDHKGRGFSSIREMCKAYGVSIRTFLERTALGEPLKFILEKLKDIGELNAIKTKDHLGNEFPSKAAMCRHYGISPSTLSGRLKRGMTLAEALLTPKETKSTRNKKVDTVVKVVEEPMKIVDSPIHRIIPTTQILATC